MLSSAEYNRYSRQVILPDLGVDGQKKLKEASVLMVGAGGLGCPVLIYLAAAGVGKIGIIDDDKVSLSNLHRQVLYTTEDVGVEKVAAAKKWLSKQNPQIEICTYSARLTSTNAMDIFAEYDVVIDGSDNFPTRYLVNDACILSGKPMVYGAIHQFEGQVSVFNYASNGDDIGPNYRDLFPQPPAPDQVPNCAEAGVLGILPGIIGSLQANEVIKIILKWDEVLSGELLIFDARSTSMMKIKVSQSADNPLTGDNPSQKSLIDYADFCGLNDEEIKSISSTEMNTLISNHPETMVIDVREKNELVNHPFEGLNIPMSKFHTDWKKIQMNGPVVVVCRTGRRSREAIQWLRQQGYQENIYNLEGGVEGV